MEGRKAARVDLGPISSLFNHHFGHSDEVMNVSLAAFVADFLSTMLDDVLQCCHLVLVVLRVHDVVFPFRATFPGSIFDELFHTTEFEVDHSIVQRRLPCKSPPEYFPKRASAVDPVRAPDQANIPESSWLRPRF